MGKRTYKPLETKEPEIISYGPKPLPTSQPCAIYARQSTVKQVLDNPESAKLQTEEQLDKARTLGWKDETIFLYVENEQNAGTIKGVSGTLRIDQREGLNALMERVYKDEIKTIFAYNESRLFRDEWQIQVDTFIKACYDHDVRLVTNTYRYDFRRQPYDADQFRMLSRIAADFIKHHVRGLLHPARERVSLRGQYDGRQIPTGFIIDQDRNSDSYKRYHSRRKAPAFMHGDGSRAAGRRRKHVTGRVVYGTFVLTRLHTSIR
jgi:DNA invertase Pin-like site-specific DNA recombinase